MGRSEVGKKNDIDIKGVTSLERREITKKGRYKEIERAVSGRGHYKR